MRGSAIRLVLCSEPVARSPSWLIRNVSRSAPFMKATVTSTYDADQDVHDLRVKEDQREVTVMALMRNRQSDSVTTI